MTAVLSPPEQVIGRKLGDVNAVATKHDCSPRHIYRLADAGRLPAPLKTIQPQRMLPRRPANEVHRMQSTPHKTTDNRGESQNAGAVAASAYPVKRKDPLTTAVNGSSKSGRKDLNLRLPGPKPSSDDSEPPTVQGFTPTPSAACTGACTSMPENDNAGHHDESEGTDRDDPLAKLAATLLALSPADCERLAAILTSQEWGRATRALHDGSPPVAEMRALRLSIERSLLCACATQAAQVDAFRAPGVGSPGNRHRARSRAARPC